MFWVLTLVLIAELLGAWDMPQQWGFGFSSHTDYTHTNLEVEIVQRMANHEEDEHFVYNDGNFIATTKICLYMHRE